MGDDVGRRVLVSSASSALPDGAEQAGRLRSATPNVEWMRPTGQRRLLETECSRSIKCLVWRRAACTAGRASLSRPRPPQQVSSLGGLGGPSYSCLSFGGTLIGPALRSSGSERAGPLESQRNTPGNCRAASAEPCRAQRRRESTTIHLSIRYYFAVIQK